MLSIFRTICAMTLLLLPALAFAQNAENLVTDPGMEEGGWDTVVIGNPTQIEPDTEVKRGGNSSMRIVAADSARSYVRSKPIAVAPGERIKAGAWVKFKDVPEKMGTVIAIAEWTGADGRGNEVSKIDVATRNGTDSDWQYVAGTVEVPQGAANLRVRLGFSYSRGTCWWDDVTVTSDSTLSMRIDLTTPRVTPAMPGLPITIINRQKVKERATVKVTAGKVTGEYDVSLSGGTRGQSLIVPLPLANQKGKIAIAATLSLKDGSHAEAKFDGVIPTPLLLGPVSPTHWCVEDGPAEISGDIDLSVAPADVRGAILSARILDASGKERAARQWKKDIITGKLTPFALTAPNLKEGEYKVVVEFNGVREKLKAEQPLVVIPRRRARVTVNPAGFPVYDGTPIWPMGIFNGGRFEEQEQAGFTISHAYNAVRVVAGRDPEDQKAKNFLDASLAHHQMAVCMVPLKFAEEGDWDAFRKRIRLFRNHPALLAWDEEEGLARGDWKKETREKAYKIIKEEDPNHPFMVGDSRDVITKMGDRSNFFDVATMDLGMWWWYPFPLAARGANALEGEEASKGSTLEPPAFLVKRNTTKPIWAGIQAYNKNPKTSRFPTPTEYRLQAYYAIIVGAQGLMWYGGGVTGGMHTDLKNSRWDYVQELVRELRALDWAWLSPTAAHWEEIDNLPVAGAVKKGPKGTIVVVANRGDQPADVTLPLNDLSGQAQVVGENRAVVLSPTFKEHFDPYAVHVYLLSK